MLANAEGLVHSCSNCSLFAFVSVHKYILVLLLKASEFSGRKQLYAELSHALIVMEESRAGGGSSGGVVWYATGHRSSSEP